MKSWIIQAFLVALCLLVYWPHKDAEFVLDDYYTIVRDPLIKNPNLYQKIWSSRLFDAHQSSGYIKFGYWRPVLKSSWILDYRLFGLNASGYQWINLLIHAINGCLVYILLYQLFGQSILAIKASALFCVLPSQEWVVRYVTGRGDELSALFIVLALLALIKGMKSELNKWHIPAIALWILSVLTREVALSYFIFAFLVYFCLPPRQGRGINHFCIWWMLIGLLPFLVLCSIIPKQGNILIFHLFYFASIGFCLWVAQRFKRWLIIFALSAIISLYQGCFWRTEEGLLRHTRSLELWPRTVAAQQLLMKYDEDLAGIKDMIDRSQDSHIKSMWLRRLGGVYFKHSDLTNAQANFLKALTLNSSDVDALNALAVISHYKGLEDESFKFLNRALEINPSYPDTLRTLGIYYFIHKDFKNARVFLTRTLAFEPENSQAHELLGLAKTSD